MTATSPYKTDAARAKGRAANELRRRARGQRPLQEYRAAMKPHGTIGAYQRETTWSETHCEDCRNANTLYRRDRGTYRQYEALVLAGTTPVVALVNVATRPTKAAVKTSNAKKAVKAPAKKADPVSAKASVRDAQAAAFIAGQGRKKTAKKGT